MFARGISKEKTESYRKTWWMIYNNSLNKNKSDSKSMRQNGI